jgi:hypothetical protein
VAYSSALQEIRGMAIWTMHHLGQLLAGWLGEGLLIWDDFLAGSGLREALLQAGGLRSFHLGCKKADIILNN